ncbi:asparagine synthase-related protein [Natronobeatus ordinarius]|uniref:asparagine synthase-related protein n=1 Tax=Natronobeatus ordinarius TaxID=2963433 RepID=UPI0020CE6803|nr:asparagine synthase-related protein [Natronobeatus ordinarius]
MVGLAGVVGDVDQDVSALTGELCFFGDEASTEHSDEVAFVTAVSHAANAEPQPVEVESTGELLWVWGEVYGYYDDAGTYTSKREGAADLTRAEYCARLYEEHGRTFIVGLNGSFVGVLYDQDSDSIQFFTDRLGSRPIHYTLVDDGLVFSTQIQAICSLLEGELSFDLDYVAEYFAFERSLGLKTPIDGVERGHPGAFTEIDLDDRSVSVDVQWRPVHEPLDQSFDYFVDRFVELFQSAVAERYDSAKETGVLLSGGSDSRLIMGALQDEGVTGYHINDWENREMEVARQVAAISGNEFVYLERDEDYHERSLEFNSQISNYISWYDQGHASGFADVLRNECDVLMNGHYADTLFKRSYLPYKGVPIPGLDVELPLYIEQPVETVGDLIEMYLGTKFHNRKASGSLPEYLQLNTNLKTILKDNITETEGFVDHHGVTYSSPRDAALFSECYPITNPATHLFFDVMKQMAPFRNPFFDVRLIELMTQLPIKYRLRKNVINASVEKIDVNLANLAHAGTNIDIKRSFALQYLAMCVNWAADQFTSDNKPKPYYTHGSWTNQSELIRHRDFVETTLNTHESMIDIVEWIDAKGAWNAYDRHINGDDKFADLYALVSFTSIPVTQSLLNSNSSDDNLNCSNHSEIVNQ